MPHFLAMFALLMCFLQKGIIFVEMRTNPEKAWVQGKLPKYACYPVSFGAREFANVKVGRFLLPHAHKSSCGTISHKGFPCGGELVIAVKIANVAGSMLVVLVSCN